MTFFFWKKKVNGFLPEDADFFPRLVYFKERSRLVSSLGFFFFFFLSPKYRFLKSLLWTLNLFYFCWADRRKLANVYSLLFFEGFWVYKDARFGVGSVCLFVRNRPSNFVFEWF